MRVPPYWAKGTITGSDQRGKEHTFWAWGWSFASFAEAREDAVARAKRIVDRLTTGQRPDSYAYLEHPLREEIIDSVTAGDREIAIVTRNRYGALVLNSASVLFADVDFPKSKPSGLLGAFLSLEGSKGKAGGSPPRGHASGGLGLGEKQSGAVVLPLSDAPV